MKLERVLLPTRPTPAPTTVDVGSEAPTAGEVVAALLEGWPDDQRGELAGLDEWAWGLRAWDQRSGDEEDGDGLSERWDDLIPSSSTLPTPLPSHVALSPLTHRLELSFLSVPSIPDQTTLAVYALPWTTAESLVEDICDRMGLIRRLTIGGETKGKGRDKWGGGEKVVYGLEEVWDADGGGHEVTYAVPPSTHLTTLALEPLHPPPSSRHANQQPSYRFCIPQSWLLKPTPPSSAFNSSSASSHRLSDLSSSSTVTDDGPAEEATTLKASHSSSLSQSGSSSSIVAPSPARPAKSTPAAPGSARLSLFDSIYSTFSSPSTTATSPTIATATSPVNKRATDAKTNPNRNSVISEPILAAKTGLGISEGGVDGDLGAKQDGEEDESEFEALMDDLNLHGLKRAAMAALPATQKAYLLTQHRTQQQATKRPSSIAGSLSRATGGAARPRQHTGGPPVSFKGPSSGALEQQKTGGSDGGGWSKRFSVASIGSWGDIVSATGTSSDNGHEKDGGDTTPTGVGLVVKQDTGGWGGWWGGGAGGKDAAGSGEFGALVDEIAAAKSPSTPLLKKILSLRVTLSTAPLSTINDFLDVGGLDALEGLLGRVVRLPDSAKSEVGDSVLLESVRVVRVLSNTEPGFQAVLSRPLLITYITFTLHTSFLKLRAQTADVLAAIAVLGGAPLVLSAFSEFRVAFDELFRFEWLIASLKVGDADGDATSAGDDQWTWDWKASGMALVNAISNSSEDLEERVMLRDEFGRRGLNEVIVGMRYMNPPENLVTQLDLYVEEKQEDLEDLRYQTVGHQADDSLDFSLGQLAKLAQEHSELYPVLVDTVKRYVLILERDIDNQLKADLLSVLDKFFEHAAQLDNLDDGWKAFMALFLQSIQPIVSDPGSLKSKSTSPSSENQTHKGIPSAFVEEIESLRTRVDELSDERAKLKDELSTQMAEANTFRALPSSVSMSFPNSGDAPDPIKSADKESPNFHGLVQRLVLKEKEVLRLQAEVTRLGKSGTAEPRESDEKAKRDRDRAKFNGLAEEVQRAKAQHGDLEKLLKEGRTEIKYLKLALESVHSRFHSLSTTATEPTDEPARDVDPQMIATEAIDSLTRKEEEIITLRGEVEDLKKQLSARRPINAAPAPPVVRSEQDFKARVPPPPPPPSVMPKPARPSLNPSATSSPPPSSHLPLSPPQSIVKADPPTVVFHPSTSSETLASQPSPTPPARHALLAAINSRPKPSRSETAPTGEGAPAPPGRNALMAALSGRKPIAAHDEEGSSTASPISDPASPSPAEADPRRALMAALRNPAPATADESSPSSPSEDVDPRRALMAALRKPAPPPSSDGAPSSPPADPPRPNLAFLSAISSRKPPADDSAPITAGEPSSTATEPPRQRPAFLSSISSPAAPDAGAASGRAALMSALSGGGGEPGGVPSRGLPRAPAKPVKKLKPFFWKKLGADDLGQTIWNDLPSDALSLDLGDLEETFMMGAPVVAPSKMSLSAKKNQPVTLLDITRSNNVGIMLARLKLPIPKIQQAVLAFDDETLTLDDLKALSKLLPTSDEIGRIGGFEDVSKLAKPDQYFKEIMSIPRLVERFDCMLFRRRLEFDVAEVVPDLQGLASATRELKDSARFKGVLQVVLAVGNALNTSTFRGGAGGFGMDALLKLKETRTAKPTPECPTLLHFIAKLLIKTSPSLVLFIDEMPHLPAAARISFTSVLGSVSTIVNGLDKVKTEISLLRQMHTSPASDRFIPVMTKFSEEAAMSVERIKKMGDAIDGDLKGLLEYFGEQSEGPESTRPEDFFSMVLSFSLALQKAAAEVTKHLAPSPTASSKTVFRSSPASSSLAPPTSGNPASSLLAPPPTITLAPSPGKNVGKGDLDEAIRSLHGGQRRERERADRDRPLSKIFIDGSSGGAGSVRGTIGTRRTAAEGPRRGLGGLFEEGGR